MVNFMNENTEIINFDNNKFSVLENYGENLTKKTYLTNPAICRDKEIKEVILTLLTPEKSAMLVGKPGIGKTAIVEGIAYRMQKGEVPDAIKGFDIIKVNVSSLLGDVQNESGVKENKLQILVEELKTKENIILFILNTIKFLSQATISFNIALFNAKNVLSFCFIFIILR